VPYGTFPASDGTFILAIGNDAQFARFAALAGAPGLSADPRFATNAARVSNRDVLIPLVGALTAGRTAQEWISLCAAQGIPAGPINDLAQVFASPQVASREMTVAMTLASGEAVKVIGNPLKMSGTPVSYSKAPPVLGGDTVAVLSRYLGLTRAELSELATSGVIGGDFEP
jgi:crotonobetainyl-CoA:carnitine CoA-transferase CaiB-like acyl-CoA transferase